MDNQKLYGEITAKLEEAQICQNEIIHCNKELQSIYSMKAYDLQSYYCLVEQSNEVIGDNMIGAGSVMTNRMTPSPKHWISWIMK